MIKLKQEGRILVRPPFTLGDLVYTVIGQMTLANLVSTGVDIFGLVYAPAGYTETDFNKELREDPVIWTLRGSDQTIKYIPDHGILRVDDETYKSYSEKGILLNIGPTEQDRDLGALVNSLVETVKHSEGVIPAVVVEDISSTIPLSMKDHDLLVRQRSELSRQEGSVEQALSDAQDYNSLLQAQVRALLLFIQHYLQSCAGTGTCLTYKEQHEPVMYYKHEVNHYVLVEESGGNPFSGETSVWVSYLRRHHLPDTI